MEEQKIGMTKFNKHLFENTVSWKQVKQIKSYKFSKREFIECLGRIGYFLRKI